MQNIMDFHKQKPLVLIVEDALELAEIAQQRLQGGGYEAYIATTIAEGIELTNKYQPDIIVLDVNLPDGSSLKQIDKFLEPGTKSVPSIILTTSEDNAKVTELFSLIADRKIRSYIQKSYTMDQLLAQVNNEAELRKIDPEPQLRRTVAKAINQKLGQDRPKFIANSPAMIKVKNHITSLANVFQQSRMEGNASATPVIFISGETGAGKSALAGYFQSLFPDCKSIEVDSTQLTAEMVVMELFGATKGSYTGADTKKDRPGIFETIGDGIIFFDEIGDLTPDLQSRLLLPIEKKEYRPLGATSNKKFDGIIICATNKNLEDMVEKGTFRADLYHRIKTHEFALPSLRDRVEDIAEIAQQYLARYAPMYFVPEIVLSEPALNVLTEYSWPGNVRELHNVLHKILMLFVTREADVNSPIITPDMLATVIKISQIDVAIRETVDPVQKINAAIAKPKEPPKHINATAEQTRRYQRITKKMEATGLSYRKAAKALGIPYSTAHHTFKIFNPNIEPDKE